MKGKIKFLFLTVLIFLCVASYGAVLKNNKIMVNIPIDGKSAYIKQITEMSSNTDFLLGKTANLWVFSVKKDKDYAGEEITLTPEVAESLSVLEESDTKLVLLWKNVKKDFMAQGFDVTASVWLEKENSYWDIKISANKEYGVWKVNYPYISDMDAQNGDQIMWPARGGRLYTEFDNPQGFRIIEPSGLKYSKDIGFYGPGTMQIVTFTKGDSSLYICPEDITGYVKTINITQKEDNEVAYTINYFATNPGDGGQEYQSPYPFNIAVVKGDWYNCAKKYRAWGIKNKYGTFQNGKMEKRADLPEWFKKNNVWFTYEGWFGKACENMVKAQEFLDMPVIAHIYSYSQYDFDTHYPAWLPVREGIPENFKILQDHNVKIMPYTNGHLVDVNLSPYYRKYGDVLVQKNENGDIYYESWAENLGAKNVSGCIADKYHDAYKEEVTKMVKILKNDCLYMDQIGAMCNYPCFNELHSHPHAGDHAVVNYNKIIGELRNELGELRGENFPITTEDSADAYAFDGVLRINDGDPALMYIPFNMFVNSDYVVHFGVYYDSDEIKADYHAGILKNIINLTRGYQLGWHLGSVGELENNPEFGEHFKSVAKARETFVDYFNFGEMVRPVSITSHIPVKNVHYFYHSALPENKGNFDFQMVRTCSFNYKGKTMICFANGGDEAVKVKWNAKASDLNLKNKSFYNIKLAYGEGQKQNKKFANTGKKGFVGASFEIAPRDTVMFIAE